MATYITLSHTFTIIWKIQYISERVKIFLEGKPSRKVSDKGEEII